VNTDLSKRQRAIVRDLAAKAHERELRKLLTPVADACDRWRAGNLDTWDLLAALDGLSRPRRRLAERYEANSVMDMMVAYAYVTGLLRADEVPAEIVGALAKPISFYRSGLSDGSVSMEAEAD
jgi:hypothetical protein